MSLLLTLLVEGCVFLLWTHAWKRKEISLVVLVNFLTNPAVVWILQMAGMFFYPPVIWGIEIAAEVLVIVVEALVYLKFSKEDGWNIKRPVLLAVTANLASWGIGILLKVI